MAGDQWFGRLRLGFVGRHCDAPISWVADAALPAPFGRTMMLNQLSETLHLPDGTSVSLCGKEGQPDSPEIGVAQYLAEFKLEQLTANQVMMSRVVPNRCWLFR
jgi:hypothetical protein